MNYSLVNYRLTFNSKVKYDQNIIRPDFLYNIYAIKVVSSKGFFVLFT
jgi:hypothetical protein